MSHRRLEPQQSGAAYSRRLAKPTTVLTCSQQSREFGSLAVSIPVIIFLVNNILLGVRWGKYRERHPLGCIMPSFKMTFDEINLIRKPRGSLPSERDDVMNNLCNWISVPGEFVFDNGFKLPISDPARCWRLHANGVTRCALSISFSTSPGICTCRLRG